MLQTLARSAALGIPDRVLRVCAVVGFTLVTALCAQIVIPLHPVPITLQTLPVTVAAIALGPWHGAASMALYLLLGMGGLPFFADGSSGARIIFGATGGYLIAFVLVQPIIGWMRGRSAHWPRLLGAILLANAIIFALGVAWLRWRADETWGYALAHGLWPFIPGTIIKTAMALAVAIPLAGFARRRGW